MEAVRFAEHVSNRTVTHAQCYIRRRDIDGKSLTRRVNMSIAAAPATSRLHTCSTPVRVGSFHLIIFCQYFATNCRSGAAVCVAKCCKNFQYDESACILCYWYRRHALPSGNSEIVTILASCNGFAGGKARKALTSSLTMPLKIRTLLSLCWKYTFLLENSGNNGNEPCRWDRWKVWNGA